MAQKFQQSDAELVDDDRSSIFVEFTAKADCLPGQHVMILRDVTERRRAQMSLLESEERFQQMANNIQEIFWMIDAETKKALFVNPGLRDHHRPFLRVIARHPDIVRRTDSL